MTSNSALQKAKRLFDAKKAGHTGSLDPLATGMLPLCFGAATKLSQFLLSADKSYRVRARLGAQSDTGDSDGTIIAERDCSDVNVDAVRLALAAFIGQHEQTPPMYSALKQGGKRLYELARKGIEVERKPRSVFIRSIELEAFELPHLDFRVTCSKGTYVRSLVSDLAASLGTLGYVTALRRLSVQPFGERPMTSLEELERLSVSGLEALDELLEPADSVLADWPHIVLNAEDTRKILHGRTLTVSGAFDLGQHRLYTQDHAFVGIGEVLPGEYLSPRRIFL